jgi:cob(I)alamin adenosyltransferase
MKIYTKTGDQGETGLFGGKRVKKNHARIEAYGTLDELNAYVGLLRDNVDLEDVRGLLFQIQNRLFDLGSYLATPVVEGKAPLLKLDVQGADIQELEQAMDAMNENLPALKNFILPGGHTVVSYAHLARTICRRAERRCVELATEVSLEPLAIQYLNRLSDYFFVLARHLAQHLGAPEVSWTGRK